MNITFIFEPRSCLKICLVLISSSLLDTKSRSAQDYGATSQAILAAMMRNALPMLRVHIGQKTYTKNGVVISTRLLASVLLPISTQHSNKSWGINVSVRSFDEVLRKVIQIVISTVPMRYIFRQGLELHNVEWLPGSCECRRLGHSRSLQQVVYPAKGNIKTN